MSNGTSPRKRRFWQVRLSTAIAMMFASGILLGFDLHARGWPAPCCYEEYVGVYPNWQPELHFEIRNLVIDAVVHIFLILIIAVVAGIRMSAAEGERMGSAQ